MKFRNLTLYTLAMLAMFALTNCSKDDGPSSGNLSVTVHYPENYADEFAQNVEVKVVNTLNGKESFAQTSSQGIATFLEITPGSYTVSSSVSLSSAETEALTGIAQETQLSGVASNISVMAGEEVAVEIDLNGSPLGSLLFKEVYYTGSKTLSGGNYFSDQFVEIYNNSTEVIYLDNLCIADVYGVSGLINSSNVPTEFQDDQNAVYVNNVWRITGSGTDYPLEPGSSIVIAQDGVNHQLEELNPNSPVDLSEADWETFNVRDDNRDADAPDVANLERLYFTGGFDWLITVFGPGLVIFKLDDFDSLEQVPYPVPEYADILAPRIKVPNEIVIDAFEALKDGNSASFKRVPVALDAGFVYADDTYTAQSFRRKIAATIEGRVVLQDSNNSTEDFEKLDTPTPWSFN
ncbi:DUF4876 domain-containing protein [Membranihabitans marinus]|uniref:DUF4876 domain-containing protein n=1 Tax=Membranihabitans marinus TaxID=1227546 RepID=UPI001F289C7C|nr:DUF4876 domain-containing protein [Membranihabitans marinus]